jgi:hypothetical protein
MASPRKVWSALKPATKTRKLRYYAKQGLNPTQVASRYNNGTLGSQKAVRGHATTPERPSVAARRPEDYPDYVRKHRPPPKNTGGGPIGPRARLHAKIYAGIGHYFKYSDPTVQMHCYHMMTDAEVTWGLQASIDDILGAAGAAMGLRSFRRREQSPWWYHSMKGID